MTTQKILKKIALARIKSAKILIDNGDWQGSAQMMGLALECALKASACRTLRILSYPDTHKDKKIPDFFLTHSFDRLLLISGLSDTFSATNINSLIFNNWSSFTIQYQGEWTAMRYNDQKNNPFNEKLVNKLYDYLYGDTNAIIKIIIKKRRW